ERPAKPCKVRLTPSQVRAELADLGNQALAAIERDDAQGFAQLVHPTLGLDLGLDGTVKHHLEANAVRDAFRDDSPRLWSGRSTASEPFSLSLREFFARLGRGKYTKAELVGYGKVVQEDNLCGRTCIAEAIENEFPCAPFIQYAYPSRSEGMWRFVAVAFDRDTMGWCVIGLLEDQWSP
ncbi:MAG TPA: hypothetical protein VK459_04605, partial [Polyangiaceae bacterium]|nr:hypothetical protein [Polyangiaceae bacterium]